MLKISNIKIPAEKGLDILVPTAAKLLRIAPSEIQSLQILRLSIDSRKKPMVFYICTICVSVSNENQILSRIQNRNISQYRPKKYTFPYSNIHSSSSPVIIGMGPAGLFAALSLAEAGIPPIILERGNPVEKRTGDVRMFWENGKLNPSSNVQFGEGGAGTFSDGKLTTGINDIRIPYILNQFVRFGAPKDILYLAKPHIGTDYLRTIVRNMREHLLSLGCDIRFGHKFCGLQCEENHLTALLVEANEKTYTLPVTQIILAPGNSARDTFYMLHKNGIRMEPKSFAVGVRIEHLQEKINMAQYGEAATLGTLPASDYKLAVHLQNGRSVFTFCVCPGGQVVASSSEEGHVVTNGMSEHARERKNINGGLLVGVTPQDFSPSLFGGMEFQSSLERNAFLGGGENYFAPAQLVGDFLAHRPSVSHRSVAPSYLPGVKYCNLWDILPEFICTALAEALPQMEHKISGFADADAVLTAVETRSSSPVRIMRNEHFCASMAGIYPCGEGAGFAGGITSAAVDGIHCAEALCRDLLGNSIV